MHLFPFRWFYMQILYLLIPMSVVLIVAAVLAFSWAVKHRQFDDLEGPAHRILMDDDNYHEPAGQTQADTAESDD